MTLPHVCADPGACTYPACTEPRRDGWPNLTCLRCGSTGPGDWCRWCNAPVQTTARCEITKPHEHSSFDDPIDCPLHGASICQGCERPSATALCPTCVTVGQEHDALTASDQSQDAREATYGPETDENDSSRTSSDSTERTTR